ncbi:DDE-type integrase/transposase/recombinase [Agrobacterium tumefaciens]|nr:transposase family protein [Agrobacterium tumefaciens]WCA58149.1 DDE-type integrase/transposase/recombinase [Agrobacterium tumefaciens]
MRDDIIWSKIKNYHELDLPPDRENAPPTQAWDFKPRENFLFLNATKTKYGIFSYVAVMQATRDSTAQYQFVHIGTNDQIFLSDWQINKLVRAGRIRPVLGPGDGPRNVPGSSYNLTPKQQKKARRKLAYADAFEEFMRANNVWTLTDEQKAAIVKAVAEQIGDDDPPGRSGWYKIIKIARTGNQYDRLISFADNDAAKGNRTPRYGRAIAEAIEEAAQEAVAARGDWKTMRAMLETWAKPGGMYFHLRNQIVDDDGLCNIPDKKIQRVLGSMNQFVRDFLDHGPDYAERVHMYAIKQVRPEAPLFIVDVDHSTLNWVVYDDEYPIAYGRPDIIVFRDRFSGIVLGYAISFGAPSYQTFLDGLRHMMFEKDPAMMGGIFFPWWGRPLMLGIDNAKHLIGINARAAAQELGFIPVAYRPGRPWEKGALERLFGILGQKIVHRVPGATMGNPDDRDDFDEEKDMARPILSLKETKGFLDYYFAYIHHHQPTQGLDELATLKGIPADLWANNIQNAPQAPLIDPDIFTRLAGDVGTVTITATGARWEYITYSCPALLVLTTNSGHESGRKYNARRNPGDLGSIDIEDPYSKPTRWIKVPVCDADAGYATGMKLHVHRAIVKYKREQAKKADRDIQLRQALQEMEAGLVDLHAQRKKHRTATLLARFYDANVRKDARSRIVDMGRVEYSGGRLDFAAMPEREPPPRISNRAIGLMPTAREETQDTQQKAVSTRTAAVQPTQSPTFDKYDDGVPDDIADWDL